MEDYLARWFGLDDPFPTDETKWTPLLTRTLSKGSYHEDFIPPLFEGFTHLLPDGETTSRRELDSWNGRRKAGH